MSEQCRSTFNAPKPNTRFLKNIIRETDSHNAALRAKEMQEARNRLRDLRGSDRVSAPSGKLNGHFSKEGERHAKRRRIENCDEEDYDGCRRNGETHSDRGKGQELRLWRHRRDDDRYDSDEAPSSRSRRSRHHHHHRYHHHHRSSRIEHHSERDPERLSRYSKEPPGERYRSRSRSPRTKRSHHHDQHRSDRKRRQRSTSRSKDRKSTIDSETEYREIAIVPAELLKDPSNNDSDSDPLEAIVGPPPPPPAPKIQSRGRGTFASGSAIDSHFSSHYDPSVDIQPNPDVDDDWDQALEALRDRQRWQKQGAERLKAAGFTEEEVQKWENGGEKREEDVRWKGRGEGREWDRGKVIGEDGIETQAEWGRLKGT